MSEALATVSMDRPRVRVLPNVVEGLRTPLRDAPLATWSFVGPFTALTLTVGLGTGRLVPGLATEWRWLWLPFVLVVFPSLVEEVFYRGVLLPRSLMAADPARRFAAVTASTAIFVAVHPIGALLVGSESDFFLDWRMLIIVAALGYTCGYAYLRSGSLRAPILIHWLTVVIWNLFFGGVYSG